MLDEVVFFVVGTFHHFENARPHWFCICFSGLFLPGMNAAKTNKTMSTHPGSSRTLLFHFELSSNCLHFWDGFWEGTLPLWQCLSV